MQQGEKVLFSSGNQSVKTFYSFRALSAAELDNIVQNTDALKIRSEVKYNNQCVYKCPSCSITFYKIEDLKDHIMDDHLDQKRLFCTYKGCGRFFYSRLYLNKHIITHAEWSPYVCNVCNGKFSCIADLNRHVGRYGKSEHYMCDMCSCTFETKSDFDTHKQTHINPNQTYECRICYKKLNTASCLWVHEKSHNQLRPFVCTYEGCGKTFMEESRLIEHENIHTKECVYICDRCNKSFCHKAAFLYHKNKKKPCEKASTA
jgi:KRAB domain-containing zinc finger protein